jgi:hypothetical protein
VKRSGLSDFGLDYFSPIGLDFQERENKIREKTKCFKACSKCGKIKPVFKFSVDKRNIDGRTNICKACRSREGLNYYYHNQVKMLIQNREYQETNKKDRCSCSVIK